MLKRGIRHIIGRFGYDIVKRAPHWAALKTLEPPKVIVDVGVADGTPALYDAFPKAKRILIEPNPIFHEELAGRGTLITKAAGAATGEATLHCEARDPSKSSILERTELTKVAGKKSDVTVAVDTLENLLSGVDYANALLKIDTEGYELEVLKGAQNILSQFHYVITETSVMKRFEDSYTYNELVRFMEQNGFAIHCFLSAGTDPNGMVRMVDILFERTAP